MGFMPQFSALLQRSVVCHEDMTGDQKDESAKKKKKKTLMLLVNN